MIYTSHPRGVHALRGTGTSSTMRNLLPEIITFSGTEGSGKSTHARLAAESLASAGRPSELRKGNRTGLGWYRAALRRRFGHPVVERTAEAHAVALGPERAAAQRGGPLELIGYAMNAVLLWATLLADRARGCELVVFDRYAYDNLAKVVEQHPRAAAGIARLYPRPRAAFVVAASPEDCVARRSSLPRAYFEIRLAQLRALAGLCPEIIWIENHDLETARAEVSDALHQALEPV